MRTRPRKTLDFTKALGYAIAINALQAAAAISVSVFTLASGGRAFSGLAEQLLLCSMALVVCWGAVMDIRDAYGARKIAEESDMLESAFRQLNDLNGTLRAQRHDFMNHLQVVFSLLELEEYGEARDYIEKVYGDIQKVGRVLKTAHPAINALLAAKLADCETRGVNANLQIESQWQPLGASDWEMCRVLGNLIDNALDALRGVRNPALTIRMGEDMHALTFEIANNGPMIPRNLVERIFQSGFSTKGEGRGTGLAIVREIMEGCGGEITLASDDQQTAFRGRIPKPA